MDIKKEKILNYFQLDVLYEIHIASEKIAIFEKKYNKNFIEFETYIKSIEEDFTIWDDYIEWKAYTKQIAELLKRKEELKNADFKIA